MVHGDLQHGSTRYWNYLEDCWRCAGRLSAVNAIGTQLRDGTDPMAYGRLNQQMDTAAEIGRNPMSKHQTQPEYGDEQADAGRDGLTHLARPKSVSTIGGGGDTTIPSSGMTPKQPFPGIGLHDPLYGRQACPKVNSFHQGVGQVSPWAMPFSCRPLQKRGQICDIPAPPPIVERLQTIRLVRGQGDPDIHFPCSDDQKRDRQPHPVDPYSAIWDDHTYILPIHHHTITRSTLCPSWGPVCMLVLTRSAVDRYTDANVLEQRGFPEN